MKWLLWLAVLLLIPRVAFATATISSTASATNVPRTGIDLTPASYFTAQSQGNYFQDPGFEWMQFAQLIPLASATSSSFVSSQGGATGEPSNFWVGTNICSVRVGECSDGSNNYCVNNNLTSGCSGNGATPSGCAGGCSTGTCNAGTVFSLSAYSQSSGTQTFTCSGSCPSLTGPAAAPITSNQTDVVGCRVTVTNPASWSNIGNGGLAAGWGSSNTSDVIVQNSDVYDGNSSLEINSSGGSQDITFQWDNGNAPTPSVCVAHPGNICLTNTDCSSLNAGDTCNNVASTNGPFVNHPITGTFTFSFWACSTASATATATLVRGAGTDMLNHAFSISSSANCTSTSNWHQYTQTFTGNDTSSTLGELFFQLTGSSGSIIYVDDVYLGQGSSSDDSGFTADTETTLKALNVGSIRMAPTAASGGVWTAAQADGLYVDSPPMGELETLANGGGPYTYGEMAGFAASISAQTSPWYTLNPNWPDADDQAFGTAMCGWENTYSFPNQYVECDNEIWNGGDGAFWKVPNTQYPAYGLACARMFAEVDASYQSAGCSATDSDIHYIVNGQISNSSLWYADQGAYNFPNTAQYGADEAFYGGTNGSSTSLATLVANNFAISTFTTALAPGNAFNDVASGCQGADGATPNSCLQTLSWYEGGPAEAGNGSNQLVASQTNVGYSAAGWQFQILLQLLTTPNPTSRYGVVTNTFQLNQGNFSDVDIWGITAGYWGLSSVAAGFAGVPFPWFRPAGLAIELWNQAIGTNPSYYPCTGAPSGVNCAGFKIGSNWTALISNGNSTSTSFGVTFPTGTVPTVAKTINDSCSNGLADNNEAVGCLTIGNLSGGVSYSGQTGSLTLPAYSAVALLQSGVIPPGNANTNPASMLIRRDMNNDYRLARMNQ